jgi:formate/nitrite transporter FocA (FNT family)
MQINNTSKSRKRLRETKFYKFILRPALVAILAGIIIAGGILYLIIDKTDGTELKKSDTMIVLGCQYLGRFAQ